MNSKTTHIPYQDTGYFSKLVVDYLSGATQLQDLYEYALTNEGLAQAIINRKKFPVDRKVLVAALKQQYTPLLPHPKTEENIQLLLSENTFTVCTAHQPNLLTGYLYFIYKILHAIKLAETLKISQPYLDFVPVYYMGSEDNDLEELGTFRFEGKKYIWDGDGQKGAVGRMHTSGLNSVFQELYSFFGPPGENCDRLKELINAAYLGHNTIATATQYLVHELFGQYGLVIVNPDDASLKRLFIPVLENELLHQGTDNIVNRQIELLSAHNYPIQAHPRHINLFYLTDQLRERIEQKEDKWQVVNTDKQWTKDELIKELHDYPERFSPNVMLRGLFQETILPNVAFIGGGAEVAYWLQLGTLFEYHKVFYPAILLRQSILWVSERVQHKIVNASINGIQLFKSEDVLIKEYIANNEGGKWEIAAEKESLEKIFSELKDKASNLDATLSPAAAAAITKAMHQIHILEQKMLRAVKRNTQTEWTRLTNLKKELFPNNSLQERVENFAGYYLNYGNAWLDTIKDAIEPLRNEFLVIEG